MPTYTNTHIFSADNQESQIIVGNDIFESFFSNVDLSVYSSFFIITDSNVGAIYLNKLMEIMKKIYINKKVYSVVLPAGEEHKNLDSLNTIWTSMLSSGIDRKSLVINLGGGVITDMGAFAASTYMRGVDFINIPTTLLSQVDASVGGKTGVDFHEVKNIIGCFSLAKYVLVDTETLSTLPKREVLSGLAEIIKHGLLAENISFGSNYLSQINQYIEDPNQELLETLINESIKLKIAVCKLDPQEKLGIRKILNLGHTIGHAIESFSLKHDESDYLRHGECVAIGIITESKISKEKGLLTQNDVDNIHTIIKRSGLPTTYHIQSEENLDEILGLLKNDKKNTADIIQFVLLKTNDRQQIVAEWGVEVDENIIRNILFTD